MKIRNYLTCVLFFVIASTNAFAENVIGWTILPSSGLPATTATNSTYNVTYTLSNNHPIISIPISTSEQRTGPFTIVDNCNGVTLAPKGRPNSTCNIAITYSPTQPIKASLQVKMIYGSNQVLLPLLSTETSDATTATQGRLIGYMPGYLPASDPQAISSAGYTHILVAFGVFSTNSPGTIVSAFRTVTPALIQQMKSLGIKVLLSLGGASSDIPGTTVNFHQALAAAPSSTAFENAFIASLENLISQYGFDGFDFDIEEGLEPGPGGTIANPGGDIAVLANIINRMHALHSTVLLTLAPQTVNISANSAFGSQFATYSALIMQTHTALSWVGIQIYNSGTIFGIDGNVYAPNNPNTPDASVALAADLLENWPQGPPRSFLPYVSMLNPSQVVLGYLAPNASGQVDGQLPVIPQATIKRAIQCLRTGVAGPNSCDTYVPPRAYPGLGGVFGWQTVNDQNNNFNFAIGLRNCVLNGNCS